MSIERLTPNSARAVEAYPVQPEELLEALRRAVERLSRWSLRSVEGGRLRAVRRTRFLGFEDDVAVLVAATEGGASAEITSASRKGKSDLGQNPKNLRELLQALQRELDPV